METTTYKIEDHIISRVDCETSDINEAVRILKADWGFYSSVVASKGGKKLIVHWIEPSVRCLRAYSDIMDFYVPLENKNLTEQVFADFLSEAWDELAKAEKEEQEAQWA